MVKKILAVVLILLTGVVIGKFALPPYSAADAKVLQGSYIATNMKTGEQKILTVAENGQYRYYEDEKLIAKGQTKLTGKVGKYTVSKYQIKDVQLNNQAELTWLSKNHHLVILKRQMTAVLTGIDD
jgi:hypothetical protein